MILFLTKKKVDFDVSSKIEAKNKNGPSRYILKWTTSHYLFIHSIKLKLTSIWVNTFAVHIYYLFYDWLSFYFTSFICGCSCKVSTKVQSKNINGPSSYLLKWITSHYLVTNSHFSKKLDGPFSSHVLWTISYCLFLGQKMHQFWC